MSRRRGRFWSFLRRGLVAMLLAQLAVIAGLVAIDSWRKRVRPRSNVFPRSAPAEVPVRDSVTTIYTYGEDVYADMLAAIRGAERRVLFESYIIKNDRLGHEFNQVRSYLARYTADGKLDSSFGVGGKAVAGRRVLPLLALQQGGKLIVAGSVIAGHGRAFAVHRYRPDGGVDSSFGRGGKVFTDFGSPAVANALAVQANGKIVVAGTRLFNDFAVARYTSSGRPDGSFGSGGKVTTDFGSVWRTR